MMTFSDITTLLLDPIGLRSVVDEMVAPFADESIDKVAGASDRRFISRSIASRSSSSLQIPTRKASTNSMSSSPCQNRSRMFSSS